MSQCGTCGQEKKTTYQARERQGTGEEAICADCIRLKYPETLMPAQPSFAYWKGNKKEEPATPSTA
jgi:hypothetical protein